MTDLENYIFRHRLHNIAMSRTMIVSKMTLNDKDIK